MSKCTLRSKARILLSIADYLKLAHRPQGQISMQEIEKAARRWSRKKCSLRPKWLRGGFVAEAVAWLSFLGRLQVSRCTGNVDFGIVRRFTALES